MGHDERFKKIISALLKKRFYLGLFVFLPLFFSVFALAAPLIFLTNFNTILKRKIVYVTELVSLYKAAEQWTYIFAGAAFIAGLLVAYGIIKPARRLLKEDTEDIAEFGSLGREFTEIAESFRKYAYLIESTAGGIMTVNKKGEITMANPHTCYILGRSESDIVGKNIKALFNIERDFETAMRGETVTSELNVKVNEKMRTVDYTLSPIKGRFTIDGAVLSFMDTTKIKKMYSDVQKAEKLASIGTLAMEVAHEVRNPLASIRGLAQLIGEDLKNGDEKKRYVDTILKETDRLNRVVDTLFEKKTSLPVETNLREIIHRVALLCSMTVKGKTPKIIEEYDETAANTLIKEEAIFHAIYNIVLNAYEAVREDGEISIRATAAGNRITIEICSDSELSPGIDSDKIFEPDVTTKGKGHGMGLKIARDAIKSIGGNINIEPAEGKTKFVIYLPPA